MSWQLVDGGEFCLIFLDISRAHSHCDVLREDLYVQLPPEAGYGPEYCALFRKFLYGLRDANQGFEFKVRDTFVGEGYEAGLHSPCCYKHPKLPQAWAVHGDDYMGVGLRSQLLDFAQKLGNI